MNRVVVFPCHLSRERCDVLNRESGRIYTATVDWHWRFYRRSGHWLSEYAMKRFLDATLGPSELLHAHSVDAATEDFYDACKTTRELRKQGIDARFPYRRKHFRPTTWKATAIRMRDGNLVLSCGRGREPVTVSLPDSLKDANVRQAQLVYDVAGKRYNWHVCIEDGQEALPAPGNQTLAIDLGEIHPMAVANEQGEVIIFTARRLRALNQYRNRRHASIDERLARCQKGSRLWKRLRRRKSFLLARNKRQRRDVEHKVTRAVTDYAVSQSASRVVVGDIRDIASGKRLQTKSQQKISNWSHGQQVSYLRYKLAAHSIRLERQDEAYSSQTCCACGARNKPNGRNYHCRRCGFVGHRDANGAVNLESKALFGEFGHVFPSSTKYLRAFRSSSGGHPASRLALRQEAAAL